MPPRPVSLPRVLRLAILAFTDGQFMPARVRSRIMSRSNSAKTAIIRRKARPIGVGVDDAYVTPLSNGNYVGLRPLKQRELRGHKFVLEWQSRGGDLGQRQHRDERH